MQATIGLSFGCTHASRQFQGACHRSHSVTELYLPLLSTRTCSPNSASSYSVKQRQPQLQRHLHCWIASQEGQQSSSSRMTGAKQRLEKHDQRDLRS
eukprot:4676140-Amphidinium_carterae.1